MIDEKTKMAVALKRFSIISPIINGQVKNTFDYCIQVTATPIEMPHYGLKEYAPKTVLHWHSDYMKEGIDGLKPKSRSDRGESRVMTPEITGIVLRTLEQHPKAPATKIYDMLIDEKAFLKKDVSLATVRRFIGNNRDAVTEEPKEEMLRFAKENVNELWQTDAMYGPYVWDGKKKRATYLLAYIDDSSRLITHAEFYLSQDIKCLRESFKEALLRRGIPKLLYTDNGKIYRSQSFEYLCANIGVTLLHHDVYKANQKGKIERFFRTVRLRFLSCIKPEDLTGIESLNGKFANWLETDYQKKPHDGLNGETPFNYFMKQADKVRLVTDLAEFNAKFLIKVVRTVKKDATISLDNNLYETDMSLAGCRLDVKYDPEENESGIQELFLFKDDKPVGTARVVNMPDNSKRRRKGKERPYIERIQGSIIEKAEEPVKEHTFSYSTMEGDD